MDIFGADKITLSEAGGLLSDMPDMVLWAAPLMILLVVAEYVLYYREHKQMYEKNETIGSIGVAIGNALVGALLKVVLFTGFAWVYNLVPWRMEFRWWTIIPCYLLFDFCSYWSHYLAHHQRFWWATHVVHHSSENYNLIVAFRVSWVDSLKLIFLLPVMLAGFHPVAIFIASQVSLLYQFWVHTEYIPRLHPLVEYIMVTPSNHRVHHGSQQKYLNKNFGSTFIFWDRIFNTFQPEEEYPRFGITHSLKHRANPLHINFHEYGNMLYDIRKARTFREMLFYVFGDPIEIEKRKK